MCVLSAGYMDLAAPSPAGLESPAYVWSLLLPVQVTVVLQTGVLARESPGPTLPLQECLLPTCIQLAGFKCSFLT